MEDYAERIVDRAVDLGCQDAVADVSVNRSYQIRFAQNQIVISNQWRETSASVFLVYDKRVVASDIKDLTKLDAAMEGLGKGAKGPQEKPESAGGGCAGVRRVLLEVRRGALPADLERRQGVRPPGDPVPLDPGPGLPRVQRPRDRVRDPPLQVRPREGGPQGGEDRGPREEPRQRGGGPVRRRVRPPHPRLADPPNLGGGGGAGGGGGGG